MHLISIYRLPILAILIFATKDVIFHLANLCFYFLFEETMSYSVFMLLLMLIIGLYLSYIFISKLQSTVSVFKQLFITISVCILFYFTNLSDRIFFAIYKPTLVVRLKSILNRESKFPSTAPIFIEHYYADNHFGFRNKSYLFIAPNCASKSIDNDNINAKLIKLSDDGWYVYYCDRFSKG